MWCVFCVWARLLFFYFYVITWAFSLFVCFTIKTQRLLDGGVRVRRGGVKRRLRARHVPLAPFNPLLPLFARRLGRTRPAFPSLSWFVTLLHPLCLSPTMHTPTPRAVRPPPARATPPTTTTTPRRAAVVILPGLGNSAADYDDLAAALVARGAAVEVAPVARIDWARNASGALTRDYWAGTLAPRPTVDWYLERVGE